MDVLLIWTWVPLCKCSKSQSTDTELRRKVQCLLQGARQGVQVANAQKTRTPHGFQGKVFKDRVRERVVGCGISLWTFFWLVGGKVIKVNGSQHHQPSDSNQSEVYVLGGSIQLTFSILWGFQYLQDSSKDLAENIIYSPWEGTKRSFV